MRFGCVANVTKYKTILDIFGPRNISVNSLFPSEDSPLASVCFH